MKCEASEAAGEREPSGSSSYEFVRGRLGSLWFAPGAERRLGLDAANPPGMSEVGIVKGW